MAGFGDKTQTSYYNGDYNYPFVRFECGHESSDRAIVFSLYHRVEAGLGVGYCRECAPKFREETRRKQEEEITIKCVAAALQSGLTPLTGERAIVASAEVLRANLLRALTQEESLIKKPVFTESERQETREAIQSVRAELAEQTEASWWIEAERRAQLWAERLCKLALARLRAAEPKDSTRFGPTQCAHPKATLALGVRQKLLCKKCYEEATTPIEEQPIKTIVLEGLPLLIGEARIILRAEQIREKFIREIINIESRRVKDTIRRIGRLTLQQFRASWWLDLHGQNVKEGMYSHLDKLHSKKFQAQDVTQEAPISLIGTEKQVAWANKMRQTCVDELARIIQSSPSPKDVLRAKMAYIHAIRQERATWWIDSLSREDVRCHVQELLQGALVE